MSFPSKRLPYRLSATSPQRYTSSISDAFHSAPRKPGSTRSVAFQYNESRLFCCAYVFKKCERFGREIEFSVLMLGCGTCAYLQNTRDIDYRCICELALLEGQHLQIELADVVSHDAKALVPAEYAISKSEPRNGCVNETKREFERKSKQQQIMILE